MPMLVLMMNVMGGNLSEPVCDALKSRNSAIILKRKSWKMYKTWLSDRSSASFVQRNC